MKTDSVISIFSSLKTKIKKDTLSKYEVCFYCENLDLLSSIINEENYNFLNDSLNVYGYAWNLTIEDLEYTISQLKFKTLDIPEDPFEVTLELVVHKSSDTIVIFNEPLFYDFVKNLDYENFLIAIKEKKLPLRFVNESGNFQNDNYSINIGKNGGENKIKNLSNQCNFRNYSQLPFSPDMFHLPELGDTLTVIEEKFFKLCLTYCLIFISDSSELNKNNLEITISGNKTLKYNLDINTDIDIKLTKYYFEIYNWIYGVSAKTEDKLGLARNIITSYLKEDSISIDGSVFKSILSSNKIYVKGNISKYFEVRNKIIEQIEVTIGKVNESLDMFFKNFQKNILIFLSYFLSVYIYKITKSSEANSVFNKESSLIGVYFVVLSAVFLLISIGIYRLEKKRVKERYENVKKRFEDVLIKDDIEKIIKNNNNEFGNEMAFLEKRINLYIILWVISILLFLVTLYLTSDYIRTLVDKFVP